MGSREDLGLKVSWEEEAIGVPHQMEGVQRSAQLLGTRETSICTRTDQRVL